MSSVKSVNYQNPVHHSKKSIAKKALKAVAITTVATTTAAVALAYGSKTGKFNKFMKMAEDKNFFKSILGKGAKGLNSVGDFVLGKAEAVVSNIVTKHGGVYRYDKPMFKQLFENLHLERWHKSK